METVVHSIQELQKITEYKTKSLGFWYVPMDKGLIAWKKAFAEKLGGDQWDSPSTTWCIQHDKYLIRTFAVIGCYPMEE